MDTMIILGLMEAADVDEDEPPADVVERMCELGLIVRENGRWQVTELGRAALESLQAKKQ